MNDSGGCHRCKLPIVGTSYSFRLEADPPVPLAKPVKVSICTACLESMQRWMERAQRFGEATLMESDSSSDLTPERPERRKSGRRKRSRDRSRYDKQLSVSETWLRIRTALTISAVVTAFATLFVLIAVELSSGARHFPSARPERPHKKGPAVPTVDHIDVPKLE